MKLAMVTFSWPARLNRDGDLAWTGRQPTALLADICSPGISGADAKLKCAAAQLQNEVQRGYVWSLHA